MYVTQWQLQNCRGRCQQLIINYWILKNIKTIRIHLWNKYFLVLHNSYPKLFHKISLLQNCVWHCNSSPPYNRPTSVWDWDTKPFHIWQLSFSSINNSSPIRQGDLIIHFLIYINSNQQNVLAIYQFSMCMSAREECKVHLIVDHLPSEVSRIASVSVANTSYLTWHIATYTSWLNG